MKKIIKIVIALVVIGGAYAAYQFYKPHRDIQGEKAKFEISGKDLISKYVANETEANTVYLDQVVAVKGKIAEVAADHIKLESGIFCNGEFSVSSLKEGQEVSVKGRVVGYDELFEEVTLDNSILND